MLYALAAVLLIASAAGADLEIAVVLGFTYNAFN
jgi:hypothetical protein